MFVLDSGKLHITLNLLIEYSTFRKPVVKGTYFI